MVSSGIMVFQASVSGIKSALDIAKGIYQLQLNSEVKSKVADLQQALLDAQSSALDAQMEQSSLLQKVNVLEKELADMRTWEAEKQKYQLKEVGHGRGVFVYAQKEAAETEEPSHYLCPNCFKDSKSVLQMELRVPGMAHVLMCPKCGSDYYISGEPRAEHHRHKNLISRGKL